MIGRSFIHVALFDNDCYQNLLSFLNAAIFAITWSYTKYYYKEYKWNTLGYCVSISDSMTANSPKNP